MIDAVDESSSCEDVERLKASIARCRALAKAASDPEARDALLKIAEDMDTALPVVESARKSR